MLYTDEKGTIEYRLPNIPEGWQLLSLFKPNEDGLVSQQEMLCLMGDILPRVEKCFVKIDYSGSTEFKTLIENWAASQALAEIVGKMVESMSEGLKKNLP